MIRTQSRRAANAARSPPGSGFAGAAKGALPLAEAFRAAYAQSGEHASSVAEIDAWLARAR
jgi:hypothetical protein